MSGPALMPQRPASHDEAQEWANAAAKVIATVSGVSVRTVHRWKETKSLPRETACLIDQLRHGAALQMSLFRGRASARDEWLAEIKATGCFKPREEIQW